MKSIIVISTLLFVTASFMGIANYLRYNQSLSEQGLYATPAPLTADPKEEVFKERTPTVAEILEEQNETVKEEVVVQQNKKVKKHQAKKKPQQEVYHAARKPREREINFEKFSRAPMDDYEEIREAPVKQINALSPAENVENK